MPGASMHDIKLASAARLLIIALISAVLGVILLFSNAWDTGLLLLFLLLFLLTLRQQRRAFLPLLLLVGLLALFAGSRAGMSDQAILRRILLPVLTMLCVLECTHRLLRTQQRTQQALQASEQRFRQI